MKFANMMAGILAACFISGAASAATVKIDFTATIDLITGLSNSPIQTGQKLAASVFVDDSQSALSSNSTANGYWFQGGSVSNLSLGTTSAFDPFPSSFPNLSTFASGFRFDASGGNGNFGFSINGGLPAQSAPYTITQMIAALSNSGGQLFGSNFLAFNYSLGGACVQQPCDVFAKIGSISVSQVATVPVPAALPLLMLGLAGLGFAGRRRRT